MIIAKGNVSTAEGPVPVENLKPGMLVVDRGHRARNLLMVEQVQLIRHSILNGTKTWSWRGTAFFSPLLGCEAPSPSKACGRL